MPVLDTCKFRLKMKAPMARTRSNKELLAEFINFKGKKIYLVASFPNRVYSKKEEFGPIRENNILSN